MGKECGADLGGLQGERACDPHGPDQVQYPVSVALVVIREGQQALAGQHSLHLGERLTQIVNVLKDPDAQHMVEGRGSKRQVRDVTGDDHRLVTEALRCLA